MSCHNSRITPANGSPGTKRVEGWTVSMRLRTFLLLIRGRERLRDEETHPYQGSRTRTTLPPNRPLPSSSFLFVQKRRSQYKNNECNHFFCHFSSFLSPRLFYFSQHSFASLLWFSGISEAKTCLLKCLQISLGTFSKLRFDTGKCRLLYFVPQKLQLFMIKVFWSPQASLWFSSVILNKASTSTNQVQTYQATSIVVFLLW